MSSSSADLMIELHGEHARALWGFALQRADRLLDGPTGGRCERAGGDVDAAGSDHPDRDDLSGSRGTGRGALSGRPTESQG